MIGVAGPKAFEVAEDGDGLVGVAPLLQGMGQRVGRLGSERPRDRVEADGLGRGVRAPGALFPRA